MLRPATLIMKLYRAEDLPRSMISKDSFLKALNFIYRLCFLVDSNILQGVKDFIISNDNKKELVDPYAIFSFAGKKVQSKVMYNSANPEWNQNLKIGLKVILI
jgi:hypothetical protein